MRMFMSVMVVCAVAAGSAVSAQDEKIPDDSALVSIRGCARGSAFTVGPRSEDQAGTLEIEPGRRFRLNGPKKLLDEIKARERSVIEVTGLIRQADVDGPQGIPVLGGRIRIGGAARPQDPITDPRRDPSYNQAVIDVRSWRQLPGECKR